MAKIFEKTFSIVLRFSYEGNEDITEDDLNVGILRTDIKSWIKTKVGSVNKGNLSCHIVGEVSEV